MNYLKWLFFGYSFCGASTVRKSYPLEAATAATMENKSLLRHKTMTTPALL